MVRTDASAVLSSPFGSTRGWDSSKYGIKLNNSTIPDPDEVAARVGVRPCTRAPKVFWKIAWRGHGRLLPLLHWNDAAAPKDSSQSLKVLWCKGISSVDTGSPVRDDLWTFDMLPNPSRWLLRLIPNGLFPRLHHGNVEVRTAYLNQVIEQIMQEAIHNTGAATPVQPLTIRMVSIGAGYDGRTSQWLSSSTNMPSQISIQGWELDLESVIESKRLMLNRLEQRRRRRNATVRIPELRSIDLNELDTTASNVLKELLRHHKGNRGPTITIFVLEGVLIYLDKGIPTRLLQRLAELSRNDVQSHLCFADRLENVPGGEEAAAVSVLRDAGWTLQDWCPKPGLARHMGWATRRRS